MRKTQHMPVLVVTMVILVGTMLIATTSALSEAPNHPRFVLNNPSKTPDSKYPWMTNSVYERLDQRIQPPKGFRRVSVSVGSFAGWLRRMPLKPGCPWLRLYNGLPKLNQWAHHAIVLVDVGRKDLQQCADAIIRLRAEYLRSIGCEDRIAFRFTSGHLAEWRKWRDGYRPKVRGNRVSWARVTNRDTRYSNFRKYLNVVFMYAGTASLAKELKSVKTPSTVEIGNVFIQGGFPGHAVLVMDVAENAAGERVFLLAQSFMPAQEAHILRNPKGRISPWYRAANRGELVTPEWKFQYTDLRSFGRNICAAKTPNN